MKSKLTTITLALAALTVSSTVAAKTLVYCSEGSPENFNPQLYTSGTSVEPAPYRSITGWLISNPAPRSWCQAWRSAGR